MVKEIIYKIKEILKKCIKGEEIPKLQEVNKIEENVNEKEKFKNEVKEKAEDRFKLLSLQKEIEEGRINEEELEQKDINLLKKIYCEQIIDLQRKINEYQNKLKVS